MQRLKRSNDPPRERILELQVFMAKRFMDYSFTQVSHTPFLPYQVNERSAHLANPGQQRIITASRSQPRTTTDTLSSFSASGRSFSDEPWRGRIFTLPHLEMKAGWADPT
jgi:hypothetical protein